MNSPIIITGADRSGSSLIARILNICGVQAGETNVMFENQQIKELSKEYIKNNSKSFPFPEFHSVSTDWKDQITDILGTSQWMVKSSLTTQMWQTWNYAFPNARWIIVRRKTSDIINSCIKTGYMRLFKSEENRKLVQANSEREAWLWWVHKYEQEWVKMIQSGVNVKTVWPERMVTGNYAQIFEMLEWLGLQWTPKIPNTIEPLIRKDRKK